MTTSPDISLFRRSVSGGKPGGGRWQQFITNMNPNEPVLIPGAKTMAGTVYTAFRRAVRESGRHIVCRTVNDDEVWACWVVEEDE